MRSQLQHKIKKRTINLSQTEQLINKKQYVNQDVMLRYRKSSLPTSIGYSSVNMRNSYDEQSTDMYFNPSKKAKFMKQIVDNYFQDTLQKIYGNQVQSNNRQIRNLQRNIKNISKRQRNRFFVNSQNQIHKREPIKPQIIYRNRQVIQEEHNEAYQSINVSANTTGSFLPPIVESHEDVEDLGQIFPQMSETSPQIIIKGEHIQKTLTFQNQAFRIFLVLQNGQPKYRIKQFKLSGMQILKRQERIMKFGVERIWKESQINANSFVSELIHPLKNLICKLIPNLDGNVKFKIRSTQYRRYLLSNKCLELKHLIRQICTILKKIQGRVLNNKINPSNIFILKGNRVCIGEWGYSSFRDQYQIQQNKFESRVNPILKSSKQWLATPEYLSPQLLQAVLAKSEQQQPDIWENKSSSDIWSLGITIFEILTMVPIWMNQMCSFKSKGKKPIIRCGLLGTSDRKLQKIVQKQKKIQKYMKQFLQIQTQEQTCPQIVQIINRMVIYEPSERISLDQILALIK